MGPELALGVAEGAVVGDARKVGARDVDVRVEVLVWLLFSLLLPLLSSPLYYHYSS